MDFHEAMSYIGKLVKISYWDHTEFKEFKAEQIGVPILNEVWGILDRVEIEPIPFLVVVNERDSQFDLSGSLVLLADVTFIEVKAG